MTGKGSITNKQKYASPTEGFDALIYMGSSLMGREVETIRSPDIIVIAGGRSGTLGEFAIAYDEGRLIGILTGTGGIAEEIGLLVQRMNKRTGATVLYDDDPVQLIKRLVAYYQAEHRKRPSCFCAPGTTMPTRTERQAEGKIRQRSLSMACSCVC